jgi:hypothetical protein
MSAIIAGLAVAFGFALLAWIADRIQDFMNKE